MKDFLKKYVFHPIYKLSNMFVFFCFSITAMILYWYGIRVLSGVILALGIIFIVLIKIENHESRIRHLEGD